MRVTGGILLTGRAEYVSLFGPPALDGVVVAPTGLNPGECIDLCPLQVVPWFHSPTTGLGFTLNDMGSNIGEHVERVTGPGQVTVSRAGLTYYFGCGPVPDTLPDLNLCGTRVETLVYALDFSGEQTLSVDFVALAVHASSTTPAPGEVVHFQAEGVNVTLGTPVEWRFRPPGPNDIVVTTCADQLQCDFAPPSPGVMFAQSWVGSGFVGGEVENGRAAPTVTIVKAKGPNEGGSFTALPGENRLSLARPAANAKEVVVSFAPFFATPFDGTSDVLAFTVLTRIGTNASGASCGGHANAVGLRVYFDATSRLARFNTKF